MEGSCRPKSTREMVGLWWAVMGLLTEPGGRDTALAGAPGAEAVCPWWCGLSDSESESESRLKKAAGSGVTACPGTGQQLVMWG